MSDTPRAHEFERRGRIIFAKLDAAHREADRAFAAPKAEFGLKDRFGFSLSSASEEPGEADESVNTSPGDDGGPGLPGDDSADPANQSQEMGA